MKHNGKSLNLLTKLMSYWTIATIYFVDVSEVLGSRYTIVCAIPDHGFIIFSDVGEVLQSRYTLNCVIPTKVKNIFNVA